MKIEWQDTSKPNEVALRGMMMDDMRMPDQERRSYVSTLAASLNGLTLEQVESKLDVVLGEDYYVYYFTVTGDKRRFRVSKSGAHGWDGVSFTLPEDGVVQEANVY